MTSTAPRHRAPLSRRAQLTATWWPLTRTWAAPLAVPVGVLAGCSALVAGAPAGPGVGLIGLGAVALPISVATWWGRSRAPGRGRHALGRPVPPLAAAVVPVRPVPLVLEAPALATLQAATGRTGSSRLSAGVAAEDTPSRLFTVSAGGHEVEVVLLTGEEQAARVLRVLRVLGALPTSDPRDAGRTPGTGDAVGAADAGAPQPSLQPAA